MSKSYRQIGIIGTGRVASAIGTALARHCDDPLVVWGRDGGNASAAAAAIGRARTAPAIEEMARICDLLILAVSDDALEACVGALAAAGAPASGFVCHMSGKSGAALLHPLEVQGWRTAAIHPAMTFTGNPQAEIRQMSGAHFVVTCGSQEALDEARLIVAMLGGVAVSIAEAHRPLYHAALCHGANHLVTLITGACEALGRAGAEDPAGLLAPLARAAMENALSRGIAGLSGPLLRGDAGTIEGHIAALDADCPSLAPAYRAMGLATLDALEAGLGPVDTLACRTILEGEA
jgi:predicted short-subunit dehydrogenase-like oxidoreductase (DUF2520 family)